MADCGDQLIFRQVGHYLKLIDQQKSVTSCDYRLAQGTFCQLKI